MLQDDVYLSKEEEAIGVNSDMLASNQIEIVSYDYIVIADDLGESRAVNIEFLVKGSVRVVSKEVIDVIKDAYSPTKSVLLTKKKYNIGLIQGIVPSELIIKDNLYPKNEDEKISSVVFTSGYPLITDTTVEDDIIKIEGIVKVQVFYKTSEEENCRFDMCTGEIPFTSVVDLKGTKPDMNAICNVHLENIDGTVEANTIGIRATLSIATKVCYKVEKEWIVDIEEVKKKNNVRSHL